MPKSYTPQEIKRAKVLVASASTIVTALSVYVAVTVYDHVSPLMVMPVMLVTMVSVTREMGGDAHPSPSLWAWVFTTVAEVVVALTAATLSVTLVRFGVGGVLNPDSTYGLIAAGVSLGAGCAAGLMALLACRSLHRIITRGIPTEEYGTHHDEGGS